MSLITAPFGPTQGEQVFDRFHFLQGAELIDDDKDSAIGAVRERQHFIRQGIDEKG